MLIEDAVKIAEEGTDSKSMSEMALAILVDEVHYLRELLGKLVSEQTKQIQKETFIQMAEFYKTEFMQQEETVKYLHSLLEDADNIVLQAKKVLSTDENDLRMHIRLYHLSVAVKEYEDRQSV